MTFLRQSLVVLMFLGFAVLQAKPYPEQWDWPLKIGHVEIVSRGVNDFKKIQDFFKSKDPNLHWLILRTDPETPAGIYFETSLNHTAKNFPAGSTLRLSYITKQAPTELKTYTFIIPLEKQWRLLIGLTDTARAVSAPYDIFAWCITVMDAEGTLLADKKSFLWEKPSL